MDLLLLSLHRYMQLPDGLSEFIQQRLVIRFIKKGEHLYRQGQKARYIYFIESGLFYVYRMKEDKMDVTWILRAGDYAISIGSFFEEEPCGDGMVALEDSVVGCFLLEDLKKAFELFPEFREHRDKIKDKYSRLNYYFNSNLRLMDADDKYDWLLREYPDYLTRVQRDILYNWLNVTKAKFLEASRRKRRRE